MGIYRVMQRLCMCTNAQGFTYDPSCDLWVHADCGYPRFQYYMGWVNAGPPYNVKRIKLPPKSARVTTRGRAHVETD